MVMATIGSYILPCTTAERIYSIVSMLVGASLFAYGLTNMGGLLFALFKNDMEYRHRMDEINDFMHVRGIPRHLQNKVQEYYSHLHLKRRFSDADNILGGLRKNLRSEILISMHQNMVLKNEFFKALDPVFVGGVIQRLRMHSLMPGEMVMRESERGGEMFFIFDGKVEVTVQDTTGHDKHVADLSSGAFVGEIALLETSLRTASVRATTFDLGRVLAEPGGHRRGPPALPTPEGDMEGGLGQTQEAAAELQEGRQAPAAHPRPARGEAGEGAGHRAQRAGPPAPGRVT